MISLTEIHTARGGACAPEFDGVRVLAVGTGEGSSLARVAGEASEQGRAVLVRCCRGALSATGGERVVVGMCLAWDPAEPARVEVAPMQALVVVGPPGAGPAVQGVYPRGSATCRSFDDVCVAWLSGDDAALASRAGELLACCSEGERGAGHAARRRIAYGARTAMDGNVEHPLTIPELADACSTSPTVLKESFREEFGLPVYEWYRRLRMLRASELLCEGASAVGEVARQVGYANPSKFARAFSDCMGAAPSAFRAV